MIVEGDSKPAHPAAAPDVLSVAESEPDTIVGWEGVAPVTVHPESVALILITAVPVDAVEMGGLIEAVPLVIVLHVTLAAEVLNV